MAVFRVVEAFAVSDENGNPRIYHIGDLVQGTDKVLKGRNRSHLFVEAEEFASRKRVTSTAAPVETATAVPGEKRSVSKKSPAPVHKSW